jgi:hypothetical protein
MSLKGQLLPDHVPAMIGWNAPFPAVALMFAGSVKNRLRQRDGFKRNIIQVTIT